MNALKTLASIVLASAVAAPVAAEYPILMTGDSPGQSVEYGVDLFPFYPFWTEVPADEARVVGYERGEHPAFWPMDPEGTQFVIYRTMVSDGEPFPVPAPELQAWLDNIGDHFRMISDGKLDLQFEYGGDGHLIESPTEVCNRAEIFDWSSHADVEGVYSESNLWPYALRLYLFPEQGLCDSRGYATMQGNTFLAGPGGAPSQIFDFAPGDDALLVHLLGHTLGLDHATFYSQQKGDLSCAMGDYNRRFGAAAKDELRGFNAPHKAQLGWLADRLLFDEGEHLVTAVELVEGEARSIPDPFNSARVYHLSYRTGSDGTFDDGSPAPLNWEYTTGLSITATNDLVPGKTAFLGTLVDNQSYSLPGGFVQLVQTGHDDDSVSFSLFVYPVSGVESRFNPLSCSDGIDNDGDGAYDFAGTVPEGRDCAYTWSAFNPPTRIHPGEPYEVTCSSELAYQAYIGPVLSGSGRLMRLSYDAGVYTGRFLAPEQCGLTETITCSSYREGVVFENQPSTSLTTSCDWPERCVQGECIVPVVEHGSGTSTQ